MNQARFLSVKEQVRRPVDLKGQVPAGGSRRKPDAKNASPRHSLTRQCCARGLDKRSEAGALQPSCRLSPGCLWNKPPPALSAGSSQAKATTLSPTQAGAGYRVGRQHEGTRRGLLVLRLSDVPCGCVKRVGRCIAGGSAGSALSQACRFAPGGAKHWAASGVRLRGGANECQSMDLVHDQ